MITTDSIVRMNMDHFLKQNFKVISPSASQCRLGNQEMLSICIQNKNVVLGNNGPYLTNSQKKLKTASLEEVKKLFKAPDLVKSVTHLGKRSPSTTSSQSSYDHTITQPIQSVIYISSANQEKQDRKPKTQVHL